MSQSLITSTECMAWLLTRVPDFRTDWESHLRYWSGEDPGISLNIGAFCQYLTQVLETATPQEATRLFMIVEDLAKYGDESVQTAITTNCLENLLNLISAGKLRPEQVIPYLGSASRVYCIEWDRFTGCNTPGLGDASDTN